MAKEKLPLIEERIEKPTVEQIKATVLRYLDGKFESARVIDDYRDIVVEGLQARYTNKEELRADIERIFEVGEKFYEPETPSVECKTWNEFWDYVYDGNSEPHVILRNFANLISEYTDGEVCDDQMNRKVYFKYKGIEFYAHFESDDSFNIWYFLIEATDGVLDAGFHHFNRDDDFVKFMKNIVETRFREPVKEHEEDICKGIFDSIESLDKSSDLKGSDAGSDALKTLETKVNGAPKKETLTDHERIEHLERIVKSIQDEIAKLKNR